MLLVFLLFTKMTFSFCLTFFSIEKFTCVLVFMLCEDELYTKPADLEKRVFEKFALIPDHTKLVVSPHAVRKKRIDKFPETLHVSYYSSHTLPFFTRIIEIFNKRWQTLDLISMMQELKRATNKDFQRGYFSAPDMAIKVDSLSTLPTFQKKEEDHSP